MYLWHHLVDSTTSYFSPQRMMKNAAGTKLISTTNLELWGIEFLGSRPHSKKSWYLLLVKISPFNTATRRQRSVKIREKFVIDNSRKSTLNFIPLKLCSLYPLGINLVISCHTWHRRTLMVAITRQLTQLSQRNRAAGWVSFGWLVDDGVGQ